MIFVDEFDALLIKTLFELNKELAKSENKKSDEKCPQCSCVGNCSDCESKNNKEKENIKEPENEFTKSDLKVGMLVKYRNGSYRIVMPTDIKECNGEVVEALIFIGEEMQMMAKYYKDNLICKHSEEFDIVEVWSRSEVYSKSLELNTQFRKLIWKRSK